MIRGVFAGPLTKKSALGERGGGRRRVGGDEHPEKMRQRRETVEHPFGPSRPGGRHSLPDEDVAKVAPRGLTGLN